MRKFNPDNERIKRRYLTYLREAEGQDEKSLDKAVAAIIKFEKSTDWKPFKAFHIDQAVQFKKQLSKAKGPKGKPLSPTTIDATLRLVKKFFHWLAGQQGFKKVLSYPDVEYFNNNRKDARVAHTQREVQFPSVQAALHAFQAMPDQTEIDLRNKAIFAFSMLTAARVSAVASLKLKHINLFECYVFQDGREVKTKNSKTITTTFFPVDQSYFECFTNWVEYLREEKLFGSEDPLFPRPEQKLINGKFDFSRLSREAYSSGNKINAVIKTAFRNAQLPEYGSHAFRKTIGMLMSDLNLTLEQQKAWSQNIGHDSLATTVNSYMPVSIERQKEIIRKLHEQKPE